MDDDQLLRVCHGVVDAVAEALGTVADWRPSGERAGQYAIDLVADRAALSVLEEAGLGVLSEESGGHHLDAPLVAVIDPVDGSTNAARGIPWFATSICVVDGEGPRAAVVANQATGVRYHAVRGGGAWRGTTALHPTDCSQMRSAVIGLSGYPRRHFGWAQYRAFGAAALDLCSVAEGSLDAWAAVGRAHLGSWDYLGGLLLCRESGAVVVDLDGGELVTFDHNARRAVAAAATPELLDQLRHGALASRPEGG
ncbi:MAG TPA: inositol monophosphatase [Acidimicrobiales bacterium]|nr:inositol monophosphatase [Acidimicrobiales bacterium]